VIRESAPLRSSAVVTLSLVAAVVSAAFVLWPSATRPRHAHPTRTTPLRRAPPSFSISYPRGWTRLPSTDPQVALLATSPGRALALLVRVIPLGLSVTHVGLPQLPTLRPLTDRLVHADRGIELLQPPAEVDIHGLVGWAYVYTERDAVTRHRVAHVHYFIFRGPTLLALVFQVAEANRLRNLAPSLARIAATLRVT
jgi:hypothetical protein